jgi:hypothetical protein
MWCLCAIPFRLWVISTPETCRGGGGPRKAARVGKHLCLCVLSTQAAPVPWHPCLLKGTLAGSLPTRGGGLGLCVTPDGKLLLTSWLEGNVVRGVGG